MSQYSCCCVELEVLQLKPRLLHKSHPLPVKNKLHAVLMWPNRVYQLLRIHWELNATKNRIFLIAPWSQWISFFTFIGFSNILMWLRLWSGGVHSDDAPLRPTISWPIIPDLNCSPTPPPHLARTNIHGSSALTQIWREIKNPPKFLFWQHDGNLMIWMKS